MSLLKQARKNIALKFATEAVIRLLAMVFIVILARRLGDQDYGKYSLVFYFAGLITIFCDLGLNTLLVREVSRRRDLLSAYAGNILSLKGLLSLGVLLLTLGLLPAMGYPWEMVLLIFLGVLSLLGNHLVEFLAALTNSLEKFEYELAIKSLNKGLVVLIGLLALWAGAGLWGLIIIMVLAQGFSLPVERRDHLETGHPLIAANGPPFLEAPPPRHLAYRFILSLCDRLCPPGHHPPFPAAVRDGRDRLVLGAGQDHRGLFHLPLSDHVRPFSHFFPFGRPGPGPAQGGLSKILGLPGDDRHPFGPDHLSSGRSLAGGRFWAALSKFHPFLGNNCLGGARSSSSITPWSTSFSP